MRIATFSNKRYITHDFYNKQPMQIFELKLSMIIDENPHHINALERSVIHSIIRKYSYII